MSTADSKAALARAYASGEHPRFLQLLPGGTNEAWALAGVLLVVPVVPAGAPPELEVALRLRRDAMIEGRCPECGVTAGTEPVSTAGRAPVEVVLFPHRFSCPARDAHVQRTLERTAAEPDDESALERRLDTMMQASRSRVAEFVDVATVMRGPGARTRTMDLLGQLMQRGDPAVCAHLAADPLQVWSALIAEGTWKCDQCWAYFLQEIRDGFRLDPVEDRTCDLCRRYSRTDLQPLMLRVDNFIMRGGVCDGCWTTYTSEDDDDD